MYPGYLQEIAQAGFVDTLHLPIGDNTVKLRGFVEGGSILLSRAARQRQPCVNGDWLCQWEMAIFDPPQNKHPLTDH